MFSSMNGIYNVKKCGVQFSPPCVILIYEDTLSCKLRRRSMPVRNFSKSSDVSLAAKSIKDRHKRYMEPVSQIIVEKMLRLIQENMKGVGLEDSLLVVEKEYEVNPEEDLNKLETEDLDRKKAIMDVTYNKSKVSPSDPSFEYDKRADFVAEKPSEWDEDENDFALDEIPVLDQEEDEVEKVQSSCDDLSKSEEIYIAKIESDEQENLGADEILDSLEDKDPKLNIKFDVTELENELRVDDADDFWS
ncbi:centrosomal protein of 19 kDa-like [Neocloeon triangulifer]|uniref:centrosomal protein of 19 kDa-like n=1 Tax=Neocloeon triangulifer TaxID=2078957 RepID=UPI00286F37E5|nr:centrosomal protein of 19 kDa-like [Neocloeon triangulifer]